MIDWSQFTTTFRTYDKLYHAVGCFALFMLLAQIARKLGLRLWVVAVLVWLLGLIYEFLQIAWGSQMNPDGYDLIGNTVGILVAWAWMGGWMTFDKNP